MQMTAPVILKCNIKMGLDYKITHHLLLIIISYIYQKKIWYFKILIKTSTFPDFDNTN